MVIFRLSNMMVGPCEVVKSNCHTLWVRLKDGVVIKRHWKKDLVSCWEVK